MATIYETKDGSYKIVNLPCQLMIICHVQSISAQFTLKNDWEKGGEICWALCFLLVGGSGACGVKRVNDRPAPR